MSPYSLYKSATDFKGRVEGNHLKLEPPFRIPCRGRPSKCTLRCFRGHNTQNLSEESAVTWDLTNYLLRKPSWHPAVRYNIHTLRSGTDNGAETVNHGAVRNLSTTMTKSISSPGATALRQSMATAWAVSRKQQTEEINLAIIGSYNEITIVGARGIIPPLHPTPKINRAFAAIYAPNCAPDLKPAIEKCKSSPKSWWGISNKINNTISYYGQQIQYSPRNISSSFWSLCWDSEQTPESIENFRKGPIICITQAPCICSNSETSTSKQLWHCISPVSVAHALWCSSGG